MTSRTTSSGSLACTRGRLAASWRASTARYPIGVVGEAVRVAAHELALAAHRALGGQDERIDLARRAVLEVLDGARTADVTEGELDAYSPSCAASNAICRA